VNLPDPVKLGLTIRYFNYDDVDLYFQITGSATGYTFGTVNLGLLASGANAYGNLDAFASRAKPSVGDLPNGEMEENITLTLKAYTDSGYTTLKWTFARVVTVHWINSADVAFTVDFLNNFDDGTVQGWAVANENGNTAGYPTLSVVTNYVLSTPYSINMIQDPDVGGVNIPIRARLYKSFTTPNKTKVFAIIDVRVAKGPTSPTYVYPKNIKLQKNSDTLVFIGKPFVIGSPGTTTEHPVDKWLRIVAPLPANTTLEIRIVAEYYASSPHAEESLWLDDFKILSK
jgi:hypothetical protein